MGVCGKHYGSVVYGHSSILPDRSSGKNPYNNQFGTEIALFRTSGGGMSRMLVSLDSPGYHGEIGPRARAGLRGRNELRGPRRYHGPRSGQSPRCRRAWTPAATADRGQLTEEFITAILQDRAPLVDISWSLNMTVCGIVAHESALKGGELLKIPHFPPLA